MVESDVSDSVIQTSDIILGNGLGSEPITKIGDKTISNSLQVQGIDRRFVKTYKLLDALLGRLGATTLIATEAKVLARRAIREGLTHGRRLDQVSVACVMIACKRHGRVIKETEIMDQANVNKRSTRRVYRYMLQRWNITYDIRNNIKIRINKACNILDISYKTRNKMFDILASCPFGVISHPGVCAAGIIYLVCRKSIKQDTISSAAGVTTMALRNFVKRYKEYERH